MKKKIFAGIAVLAFATVVGLNIKMNGQDERITDFSLSNVEALANGESGSYSCRVESKCYSWSGTEVGTVSCTGTTCERGTGWVKCDGRSTSC